MIQATKPTFSFGVLFLIAVGLIGAVFYLSRELQKSQMLDLPVVPQNKKLVNQRPAGQEPVKPVSTADWKDYTDSEHAVSFKYPQKWQVRTYTREDFDIIVITPDQGEDKIRIYVSPSEYVGLAGLQTSPVTVGGMKGVSANNMVMGVKQGANYFTFDAGQDQKLLPEFNGIIKTVAFNR